MACTGCDVLLRAAMLLLAVSAAAASGPCAHRNTVNGVATDAATEAWANSSISVTIAGCNNTVNGNNIAVVGSDNVVSGNSGLAPGNAALINVTGNGNQARGAAPVCGSGIAAANAQCALRGSQVLNNTLHRTDPNWLLQEQGREAMMLRGDNNVVESNDVDYINMAMGWCVAPHVRKAVGCARAAATHARLATQGEHRHQPVGQPQLGQLRGEGQHRQARPGALVPRLVGVGSRPRRRGG